MNCPDLAINKFNDHMAVKVNELPPTLPKSFFKEHKFSFADSYDVRCRYTSRIGWFILTTEVKEILVNFLKGKRVLEVGSGTGDDDFFNYLDKHFTPMKELDDELNEHHTRFPGINDYWWVYVKN